MNKVDLIQYSSRRVGKLQVRDLAWFRSQLKWSVQLDEFWKELFYD